LCNPAAQDKLTETVKQRFDAEGVSIPFRQRDVHIYQRNADA
jgi:small conductance mechanosensitive channel